MSVLWDARRILLIDFLQRSKKTTGKYYLNLLDQLDAKIREKRPGLKRKTIIFHRNNARAHESTCAMKKLRDFKYEVLNHPSYSPDLAPSDFYLLPNLKKFLAGKRFSSNEDAIAAVEGYFAILPESQER